MNTERRKLMKPAIDDRDRSYEPVDWHVAHKHGQLSGWPMWIFPAVGCPAGLLIIILFAYDVNVFGLQEPLRELLSFVMLMGLFGVMWWASERLRRTRASAQRVEPAMLAVGRCPGCAYPLSGLTPEPDNCIQCPECGAAWKAERVGKPVRGK